MLNTLIRLSLRYRTLVIVLALGVMVYGGFLATRMPIDVFPDLDRPRVVILTECRGLAPGDVEALLPALGDIHQVTNALSDCGSISIHVYGGNIGAVRRHTFDAVSGEAKLFVSGYTNQVLPNLWDRSAEARATA